MELMLVLCIIVGLVGIIMIGATIQDYRTSGNEENRDYLDWMVYTYGDEAAE